jgi:hypothetical protein
VRADRDPHRWFGRSGVAAGLVDPGEREVAADHQQPAAFAHVLLDGRQSVRRDGRALEGVRRQQAEAIISVNEPGSTCVSKAARSASCYLR